MKNFTCIFLFAMVLIVVPGLTRVSTLHAQSWTAIDGSGTGGINTPTAATSIAPSVAVYNGELYVIWCEMVSGKGQIHVKKYNGSTWSSAGTSGSQIDMSATGAENPKLVVSNGFLYAAWQEYDNGIYNIHVKQYNGSSWTFTQNYTAGDGRMNINHGATANAQHVDLAVLNNQLYATWVEQDNDGDVQWQLRVAMFNGSLWSSIDGNGAYGLNYNTGYDAYLPRLGTYNNNLYLTWTELNASGIKQLHAKRYDGSSVWTLVGGGATGLNYNVAQSPENPVLVSYNSFLYLLWAEYDATTALKYKVRVKRYNGTTWTTDPDGGAGWHFNPAKTTVQPSAYTFSNLLYVAWEENKSPYQIRIVSFDGTSKTFIDGNDVSGINQNIAMRAHNPELIEYSGDLYAIWNEDNAGTDNAQQIRAKKYPLPSVVSSVNVPANGKYGIGQTLNFTVNFNKAVTVTGGTPYIPFTMNTVGTVNASYISGSGTTALVFQYTVAAGNADNDGISVGTAINSNGGSLKDAAGNNAILTLSSVGNTTGVLVDGVPPIVSSVSATTTNGIYKTGDVIAITVAFTEAVTVTGTPTLALNSGVTVSYSSGSGSSVLTFNYTIGSGHSSADLDYMAVNALSLAGGSIKDGTGNNAISTLPPVGGTGSLGANKDIVIDGIAPTVSSVAVPANATYIAGQNLDFTINFNEPVAVVTTGGTPYITVTLNSGAVNAAYVSGSGTTSLVFRYTIVSGNADNNGIAVGSSIAANGGTLKDAAGNNATLTLNSVGNTTGILVDAVIPTVTSVGVPANSTYTAGQNLDFTVNFSETVNVVTTGGAPYITVALNTGAVNAAYVSGSGTTSLVFRYTIVSGNADNNGIAVGSSIAANGGTLKDAAGNNATLTLNSVGSTTSVFVDASVPTITSVGVPANAIYKAGQNLDFTVNFNEPVTVVTTGGTPYIPVTMNTGAVNAVYVSGSGTSALVFRYTIVSGNFDNNGVALGSAISANGGTIKDAVGNNATLTLNSVASTVGVLVDAVAPGVTISATSPTHVAPIPVNIQFTEPVIGFDASDITVTNGSKGTLSGSGANYTINITPSADGMVTIAIAGSVATDAAGNNNTPATSLNITYDSHAPSVDVTSTVMDPTNLLTIPIKIVFSEVVTGFILSDIIVDGGIASDLQTTDNIHWTASVTFAANMGAKSINIAAGSVQDLAGNGNTAAPYFQRTYDPKPPTVTISSTSSNPTKDKPIVVKMKFSETVVNFKVSNIVVTNGTVSNLQTDYYQEEWTADIYPAADGVVTVDLPIGAAQDYAGNNSTAAAQFSRTWDITPPTVIISSTTANTTRNNPIPVRILFSESVTGFNLSDISVTNGTASNLATSDNIIWTADITPSANGTVALNIAAGVAQDAVGNNNSAASEFTRIYDLQAPSVVISSVGTIISDSPKSIIFTFSEPVTGFELSDIAITNGSASNLTGSGSSYSVMVTATGSGAVSIDVAANAAQDAAGNTSLAASTLSLTYITAPTIASVTPSSRCGAGIVTLEATASAGTINWYANATGGASLGTGESFTTSALDNTTSFYVDATNSGATTPTRTEVVATINAIPSITATTPASRCGNGTVSLEVSASAGSINWYSAAEGGDVLGSGNRFVTPAISATTTYYVAASNNGCESASRTAIVATVNNVPEQPSEIAGNTTVTKGTKEAYNVISVSGVTYEWTATAATVVPNSNSAEITWNTTGAQTVTVTPSNNCGAGTARTLNVTVTSSTGINDEPVVTAYKIYPNPARDFVKIERAIEEECRVMIYSLDNKLVLEKTIYAKLERIEISSLGAGVYTIIITNNKGERSVQKLVRL